MRSPRMPFQLRNSPTVTPKRAAIVDNESPERTRYWPEAGGATRAEAVPDRVAVCPGTLSVWPMRIVEPRMPFQARSWATEAPTRTPIVDSVSPRRTV